jgi:hypothetical protein
MMRRIGTVVGLLAVIAAGSACAADQLVFESGLDSRLPGAPRGDAPTGPLSPWSSDNTIFGAPNSGQFYTVMVDGVEVGAFSTSTAPDMTPSAGGQDAAPAPRSPMNFRSRPSPVAGLVKPAAWLLLILGFFAIGLTLRGGRRTQPGSA